MSGPDDQGGTSHMDPGLHQMQSVSYSIRAVTLTVSKIVVRRYLEYGDFRE